VLPRSIYHLLPYFYICLGLLCMILVESRLIFFSSTLLMVAGALVLWMRYKNSVDPVEYINSGKPIKDEESEQWLDESTGLLDHERRIDDDRAFPLVDDNGVLIPFERRKAGPD
jgi:hypothetical protein